jgi:hypothetical protein
MQSSVGLKIDDIDSGLMKLEHLVFNYSASQQSTLRRKNKQQHFNSHVLTH